MTRFKISGVPIVDDAGKLVGIITNRDLQFERQLDRPLKDAMTKDKLVTAPVGTTMEEAERLLGKTPHREAAGGGQAGRAARPDHHQGIFKRRQHPDANKDQHGRLRVAAAVGGTAEAHARAKALLDAGADVIVIDSAHGHSKGVLDVRGAVARGVPRRAARRGQRGDHGRAKALVERGVDAVKVASGPARFAPHASSRA